MSYWTITFESPEMAANAARVMRAYYFDPNITGPDPKLPTLKYFDSECESREYVEGLFSIAQNYGAGPISITPPYDYEKICREIKTIKPEFTLEKIWPSGFFSDVTLLVEGEEFKVHRAVLASVSDYFTALFTRMPQPVIELKELEPELFSKFLDFIYLGLPNDDPYLLPVLVLARRFQVHGLNYEEAVISFPETESEDMPVYISLLRLIFPNGFPESIILLLEEMDGLDLNLLTETEREEILKRRARYQAHLEGVDEIRRQRMTVL